MFVGNDLEQMESSASEDGRVPAVPRNCRTSIPPASALPNFRMDKTPGFTAIFAQYR
jgi:hypothetical protein